MEPLTVIGSYLSPYVRKVLVCLELKSLPYRIDPIVPFYGNDEFSKLSPLRRIPVLIDGANTMCDSTVICEYLDERYPEPAIYPADVGERARCRWLEEYADTRMGEVFIWHYFNQLVIRRFVWGEPADPAVLTRALEEEIPAVLDYLETQVPARGCLFDADALSVADVAIGAMLRNAAFARFSIDAAGWPRCASFAARVHESAPFLRLRTYEELLLKTPIGEARRALSAAGAPLTEQSWGTERPTRGIMTI